MAPATGYSPLDDVDRRILELLQRDARNATAVEIAEEIAVSDGTVRNRIDQLEEQGIIEGYVPIVNYERAGYPLAMRISCTAPLPDRHRLAEEAQQVGRVVEVSELTAGRDNIEITAVAPTHEGLSETAEALHELGLQIESQELISDRYVRPFDLFGGGAESGSADDG